ncbi:MAG: Eco57I restriction-modification methylase domain-containing protein [Cytophagales bacterium]|nr:Eco57I restriction-modification methylase domain-containing protein [Cytophagales bacterium]
MHSFNQEHIKQFRFKELFNELGWDRPAQQQPFSIAVGDSVWLLDTIAVKKGVQILHCRPNAEGRLPDYATRQKIERKVTNEVREHLIVFTDKAQTRQVWQWVTRMQGKTAQYREVVFNKGETPELLTQKLSRLHFTLDEETLLTVLGVTARLDDAAPREKVTKKFYTDFEKQRKAFAEFIHGIPATSEDQRWYTAVLIDRLMFLWFLQEKSFLDGKERYLQSRLASHLAAQPNVTFYKNFLCPLFFRGFAEERSSSNRAAIAAEFGDVPYLNGGLFAPHQLEQKYGEALDVEDNAFFKLFDFFDEWEWHLDERPLKRGKEINPDVLGYIFEKFVNQKQMGAYYTKEDITDYIGKNTIIPCLLAKVRADHPTAFDALAWPLLAQSGDAYIYPAMRKGVDSVYPPEIANGIDTDAPDLLSRRKHWNKRADDASSLPTEIWRETIARHERTREIRAKITAGELREVGDLITYNLDIRQFAQDLIEGCTDVALLKSFWFALAGRLPRKSNEKFRHGMSVLDPTCGSGAFLFAALNILKPLYDATLRTLQAVRVDALISGEKVHPERWSEVDEILERFAAAGSERAQDYAIIKHIIVNNLYGVDIEEQATEIAKLRLFLKLVALLEPGDNIEPLPDIDFNIRHGNTLVGYATADETEKAVKGATQGNLFSDAWEDIRIDLVAVEQQYNNFQIQQVQRGGHVTAADKQALTHRLGDLEEKLNYHLAREYGVNTTETAAYEKWKLGHQPFHWYVDFYPLMASGGFDVVIGNPPYLETREIDYTLRGYITADSNAVHSVCMERSNELLKPDGTMSMIVPLALVSTQRMKAMQTLLEKDRTTWYSNFAWRPAKLFDTVNRALTIFVVLPGGSGKTLTTGYTKWTAATRAPLIPSLMYQDAPKNRSAFWVPKLSAPIEQNLLKKMLSQKVTVAQSSVKQGERIYYRTTGGLYWKVFTNFAPRFVLNGTESNSSRETSFTVPVASTTPLIALLSSNTFWWWYTLTSNLRDLNPYDVQSFPVTQAALTDMELVTLADAYVTDMVSNSTMLVREQKKTGTTQTQSFKIQKSKPLIDDIDKCLAKHYGFTPEELDYIINYDIKYRMGQGLEEDGDD